ncbi:MAG: tetratricopeptide repeat protein [Candidatus Aminicenantes bacterium]|nr:MAG: tetratricopeptide repeat protein [Candidatus Aminicenantes bacterium]
MKKISILWLALLVLMAQTFVYSQGYKGKGKVKGIVTDQDANPIEGVTIKLYSQRAASGFEVKTDKKGKWKAFYIRGGPYDIDFEKPGFMPKKISANINEFGKNADIEVTLQKTEGLVGTDDLKVTLKKGNDLFNQDKYEEAIQTYQTIIEKTPETFILYRNIGNCYFQMEKYEMAEEFYRKVLEKEPDDTESILGIGNTYANRGQGEKALEWYNKIKFEKISDPMVLYNIGSNFYTQGQHQEALKYYRKAVKLKGDFLDALYQLGLVNLTLENNQEAIDVFQEYLKYDLESVRADQVRNFIEFLKKK